MGFQLKEANGNGGVRLLGGGGVNYGLGWLRSDDWFGWFNNWLGGWLKRGIYIKNQSKVSEWLKPRIH